MDTTSLRSRALALAVPIALLLTGAAARPAAALEWTEATLFFCEESGVVVTYGRWNAGPIDPAWDVFFREGEPEDTAKGPVRWLNGADNRIKIPLEPGTHAFSFHFECGQHFPRFGMNLFFDGSDRPGISVRTDVAAGGPPFPAIRANGANPTMGWPFNEVPGAGTLSVDGTAGGIWSRVPGREDLRVTVRDFRVLEPAPAGNLDLVGPHATGPSGTPDHVGRIVLEVERYRPRLPDPALWLGATCGIAFGAAPEAVEAWRAGAKAEEIAPPFTFTCGGRPARELLGSWKLEKSRTELDVDRVAHVLAWIDPGSGLTVRWEGVEYRDSKTVEWTLWFRNAGPGDSPVIADILPLDLRLSRPPGEEYVLHHAKGTYVSRNDCEPLRTVLGPGSTQRFAPPGGRPCGLVFPYFDLEAAGEGMIVVVGWPGQWEARFERDADRGLRVAVGQEKARFRLRPGETARTPLIVLQLWKGGDWIDAQNGWRRFQVKHGLPRPGGKLPPLPQFAACSSHQFGEMIGANEENQKLFVERYLEEGLKLDYWWMDAGWYVNSTGWPHTGTWEVDRKRFPHGLRAVSDLAHSKGIHIIVWFEPERVAADTWLSRTHPEWVIGGGAGGLLDLGNPEAWKWLVERVDGLLRSEAIDLYRQDFNMDPLALWRSRDELDRQGIVENRHVQGYLAYWDELRKRHPDMLLDSCASGGHRLDPESLRRAVPLTRSDCLFEPVDQQCQTYGMALWIPYFGTALSPPDRYDAYTIRSMMCPANTACFDVRKKDLDYALIRKLVAQWKRVAPFYLGDYYPLTPYSTADDAWMAWQYHDPEKDAGVVQVFRRQGSPFYGLRVRLRGVDPKARYEVEDLDRPGTTAFSGRDLLEKGLNIAIEDDPGAAVLLYRKAAGK